MFTPADITPDYTFYASEYHGKMAQSDFEASLSDAVADVEYRIWRYADITPHIDRCKMAVCAVAEALGNPEKRRKSYTAGKIREDFIDAPFSLRSEAAVKRYLSNTGILKGGQWV